MAETKRQLDEYERQATEDANSDEIEKKFTGVVFIVFESPSDCITIRRNQKLPILKYIFGSIFYACKNHSMTWYFERAPEPTDIYWENLGTSTLKRIFKTTISYILSLLLLAIGFGIISSIKSV
jgi:hypothetical protein